MYFRLYQEIVKKGNYSGTGSLFQASVVPLYDNKEKSIEYNGQKRAEQIGGEGEVRNTVSEKQAGEWAAEGTEDVV